jgi:murein DD-endopeptidase MepM/ murein hydrolase activator NlpD
VIAPSRRTTLVLLLLGLAGFAGYRRFLVPACDDRTPRLRLPIGPERPARVVQGPGDGQTHAGAQHWAWDFALPVGTEVYAAAPGRVVEAVDGFDSGAPFAEFAWRANNVVIDHGDNRFSIYFHLKKGGVLVKAGDEVFRGQKIGLSGNSGYSFGPHLHFAVTDQHGVSVPVCFDDAADERPAGGRDYVGESLDPRERPGTTPLSQLPADTFEKAGVRLAYAYASRWLTERWPMTIGGTAAPGATVVSMLHFRGATSPAQRVETRADPSGKFELQLDGPLKEPAFFVVGVPNRFGVIDPGDWIPVAPQP